MTDTTPARSGPLAGVRIIDVTAVLIDPLERNVDARRFYRRMGFVDVGPRRFGSDDCMVMCIARDGWAEHRA